jgi:hypothetical protein
MDRRKKRNSGLKVSRNGVQSDVEEERGRPYAHRLRLKCRINCYSWL